MPKSVETLLHVTRERLDRVEADIRASLSDAAALEHAAQTFAQQIYETFVDSTVLVRVYATVPFERLPVAQQKFVTDLASSKNALARLVAHTPVLSLVGTCGVDPSWCDRHHSKGHVGIPLIDTQFVEAIPMVARLLHELGVDPLWFDDPTGSFVRRLIGGFNGVFYVSDAATSKDAKGRHVIPARDFVAEHRVSTVFGMGGSYLDGTLVACIVFTREDIPRAQAEQLATLISTLKTATATLVRSGRIFVD